jgi:prepilin-type N-terminal cleavage/methylation domain-containing protein
MKILRLHSPKLATPAFTLIELLVVISIIAVLASLSIPAVTGVMVNARKAQARNDMAQIASAIKLYYAEYGRYPIDPALNETTDVAYGGVDTAKGNQQIVSALRYKPIGVTQTTLDSINPRQIKFIEPKVAESTKGCVNISSGKWYDPWGTQYIIFIDSNYEDDIKASLAFSNMPDPSASVGVASVGYYYVKNKTKPADSLATARAYDSKTDLLSWQ